MFSTEFFNKVPADVLDTELVQIMGSVGDTMELAITSEVESVVNSYLDISKFSVEGIRTFLAFLKVSSRNYKAATGSVTIEMLSATTNVIIPQYSVLTSGSGVSFYTTEQINMVQGETKTFDVVQGDRLNTGGTYSNYVRIDEAGVDLTYTGVSIGGVNMPESQEPFDAYQQYYFGGSLFIKANKGDIFTAVDGKVYSVGYVVTEGLAGNIDANTISKFTSSIKDQSGNPVTYALSHDAFTNGQDEPPVYELRDTLRYWFYAKDTLTRIADYELFFKTQPEIGDVRVFDDFAEYMESGVIDITGRLRVYLVDKNTVLPPVQSVIDDINNRLLDVKDTSFVVYLDFTSVYHLYRVFYSSSTDDSGFESNVDNVISGFYDLIEVREAGGSLFNDIDMNDILADIDYETYAPKYLDIVPYFYLGIAVSSGGGLNAELPVPEDIEVGEVTYNFTGSTINQDYEEIYNTSTLYDIVEVGTVNKVGEHDYTTNTITWVTTFTEDGLVSIYARIGNRSIIRTKGLTTIRRLQSVEVTKR